MKQRNKHQLKVGLPRALLYYRFGAMWTTFFESLGAKVVLSSTSNKAIKENGLKSTLDDDCYSCKLFFGHVLDLKEKVDYFFIPRYASSKRREVGCPKFIALPDILKATIEDLPPIIAPYYSASREKHGKFHFLKLVFQVGYIFTKNPFRILKATLKAFKAEKEFLEQTQISLTTLKDWEESRILLNAKPIVNDIEEPLKVAVASHPYLINDDFASLDMRKKLKNLGVDIVTSEQMPRELVQKQITRLCYDDFGLMIKDLDQIQKEEHKKYFLGENDYLYFEFEHEIIGTVMHFLESRTIDGILMIVNFICGPVSVSLEYVKLFAKRIKSPVPLMIITLDAHTGEAGFQTRLEAFVDILRMKRKDEKVQLLEEELIAIAT